MDPSRFDNLTRLLSAAGGRRPVLRALVGAMLGAAAVDAAETVARKRNKTRGKGRDTDRDRQGNQRLEAERRGQGKDRKKRKKKRRGTDGQTPEPQPNTCCGAKQCAPPKPGGTRAGCDFAGQSFAGEDHHGATFRGIDGRSATFNDTDNHGSTFATACLQSASFRHANLRGTIWGGACLFDADFTGADLGEATTFADALFCGTLMPDGSVNDRDCERGTACCQQRLGGDSCQSVADCLTFPCYATSCTNGQCELTQVVTGPSPNDLCSFCCESTCCHGDANQCNPAGLCCAPNCSGKVCGPDGCGSGGTCGTCPAGQRCTAEGRCVCDGQSCPSGCCDGHGGCQPGDTNQVCGTDGALCAPCGAGQACLNRRCEACTPHCTGKACGPDGCGGSCGTCASGLTCDDGSGQCLCTTASCPSGCCSAGPGNPGDCLPGDTDQSCNKGGLRCVACASGSTCGGRGCQPVDCGDLCPGRFCLNLVEGTVSCQVPFSDFCNETDPALTLCTSTAECAAKSVDFTLCVASYTDPTTNQTEVVTCGGQPGALCARDI